MADLEEWRDVLGYEGIYQVSSLGRVKRLARYVSTKGGSYRLHSTRIVGGYVCARTGYPQVRLCVDGDALTANIHVLACEAFHGPKPSPGHEVAHNDGSRANNVVSNLRWDTKAGNAADRTVHGTQLRGESVPISKLTEADVRHIRRAHQGRYGDGIRLARQFGVSSAQITNIIKNRQWGHV